MKSFALAAVIVSLGAGMAAQGQPVYKVGDPGVRPPVVVKEMKPSYTADAMRQRIQGLVELQAVIDTSGKPTDITVMKSLDPTHGLDANAVAALKTWEFKPALREGKPVPFLVTVELTFTLRDGPMDVTPQPSVEVESRPGTGVVYKPGQPGVTNPRLLSDKKPSYTAAAMRAKVQGAVEIEAVIDVEGKPTNIQVVRSLDAVHGLDQKAVEALKEWRFTPAMRDGKPVPILVTIEMTFALRDKK